MIFSSQKIQSLAKGVLNLTFFNIIPSGCFKKHDVAHKMDFCNSWIPLVVLLVLHVVLVFLVFLIIFLLQLFFILREPFKLLISSLLGVL